MSLEGKRLLVIGANGNICNAVRRAKELGIYTVVTDYFEDSPAKKIADKSYLVSTADTDKLVGICQKENIDGVFTGYSELNLNFTERLCKAMGYPFYATAEQVNMLTNKESFKATCEKHGVPSVKAYSVSEVPTEEELKKVDFPVIVKPVDSYSGKGITICKSAKELPTAIVKAKAVSASKRYLVEQYMNEKDYDIFTVYYTLQDGKAALSGIVDRYMYSFPNNRRLSTVLLYPSEYLDRYLKEMDEKVKRMFSEIGLKNGTIFIEGAVNRDGFYFWECGYRLCGAQQGIITGYVNKVDVEEMLIRFALTGKMSDEDVTALEDPRLKGKVAINLLVFSKLGNIKRVAGIEEVKKLDGVINYTALIGENHVISVEDEGTLNQSVARLHLVADDREKMANLIDRIYSILKIEGQNGENLILNTFDRDFVTKRSTRFAK
ncbi:MAG: ATP-grasp domain-containing protein [Clostridia bacterium]|nr:ATP-grasp domain-containing protein [Clostridia bacterium]